MWKENNPRFRHELKYRISTVQKDIMIERLSCFLEKDKHAKNGMYTIRSLYFDDRWNSAYEEKLMGIAGRKKYRIRFYDFSDKVIKLECKNKQGSYIYKEAVNLSRAEVEQILQGDYDFLRERKESLCKVFYHECMTNEMRPRVIVDYERVPFALDVGEVRITFDSRIREAALVGDLFDGELPAWDVMAPEELIMEIKYTELLPDYIRDIVVNQEVEYIAASKYVMCCDHKIERLGILI